MAATKPVDSAHCVVVVVVVVDRHDMDTMDRVPTPPGKSLKVLEFFFKISRTCKVLENAFGPGNQA